MLVINPLLFPAIAIHCTICLMNVEESGPGEVLHIDVSLTTVHTLVRFWVRPSRQMPLQVCHKRYEKVLTCALCMCQSLLRHCKLCIEAVFLTSALNCYEIQLFFQNTSVVLLDIQPYLDPIWRCVVLQGHVSGI